MTRYPVVIIGAGPAGLTAGYELLKCGMKPLILEQAPVVGGISRTEIYKGYRFDIGGHRFFTKIPQVDRFWHEMLDTDLIQVARLSRIYYRGKFYNYPLSVANTLANIGLVESCLILVSYLHAQIKVKLQIAPVADTFEQWAIDRFGRRLYQMFFKTYTEKVWGIPCHEIRADWAAQRIYGLSLQRVIRSALWGEQGVKSLIKKFDYPRLGPGMMWERTQAVIEQQGGIVELNAQVGRIDRSATRIESMTIEQNGRREQIEADWFISTMPVTVLLSCFVPPPPVAVLAAAKSLKYRDFLIVALIIDRDRLFPDNWIYIHSPEAKVGRIQNFKNWSAAMVPEPGKTCLGMEYFCSADDELWSRSTEDLIKLATQEAIDLNIGVRPGDVIDGTVIRQPKAYPIYDGEYQQHLQTIQTYLAGFENLQTVGRNGMHHYNNQDHSMLTAMLAVENILGKRHNLWEINIDNFYQENFD
jgi:protoporphyrinogen oxidase